MQNWSNLEHRFWKTLKENNLENSESYLLTISGGLDSMVLLEMMSLVKPNSLLRVAHYHHGESDEPQQKKYRDDVLNLVKQRASQSQNIQFLSETSSQKLTSEAEFRQARWDFFRRIRKNNEPILTAHHQDDWAETLVLKLIRGTSLEGISQFKVWNNEILRPFLSFSKSELLNYAQDKGLDWLQDPSNQSDQYLRNWLRESWFKQLEDKVQGGYLNFSKSLIQIASELSPQSRLELVGDGKILDRKWYDTLSKAEQVKALALFLKKNQLFEFTRGHLEEIQKRLDKNQKDITFVLLERKWVINASQIVLDF